MSKHIKAQNKRPPMKKGVLKRLFKLLLAEYRKQLIIVAICIALASLGSTVSSLFMNTLITDIGIGVEQGWDAVKVKILTTIGVM